VQHPAFHARHAPRRQAEAAADATLLIHEATFEDPAPGADWREVALAKRHSMTGEAVEIGVRARAFRTILTHFSQRYPKIPAIGASFTASTCIAFDLLSVNLAGAPAATCPGRARAQQPLIYEFNLGLSERVCSVVRDGCQHSSCTCASARMLVSAGPSLGWELTVDVVLSNASVPKALHLSGEWCRGTMLTHFPCQPAVTISAMLRDVPDMPCSCVHAHYHHSL